MKLAIGFMMTYALTAVANCADEIQGLCLKCNAGFHPVNVLPPKSNEFEGTPNVECQKDEPGCKEYYPYSEQCHVCNAGYYRDRQTCKKGPAPGSEHCKKYQATYLYCQQCDNGYHLVGDGCVVNDPSCVQYYQWLDVCEKCATGFNLDYKTGKCTKAFVAFNSA